MCFFGPTGPIRGSPSLGGWYMEMINSPARRRDPWQHPCRRLSYTVAQADTFRVIKKHCVGRHLMFVHQMVLRNGRDTVARCYRRRLPTRLSLLDQKDTKKVKRWEKISRASFGCGIRRSTLTYSVRFLAWKAPTHIEDQTRSILLCRRVTRYRKWRSPYVGASLFRFRRQRNGAMS